MSHKHGNCPRCTEGVLTTFCDFPACENEFCTYLGHCDCKCHSGKTCDCGHAWPRMEKQ